MIGMRVEGQIKRFPDKAELKEFIITKLFFLYEMLKYLSKKKIKTMKSKMTTNSQPSATKPKNKLRKQLEQE